MPLLNAFRQRWCWVVCQRDGSSIMDEEWNRTCFPASSFKTLKEAIHCLWIYEHMGWEHTSWCIQKTIKFRSAPLRPNLMDANASEVVVNDWDHLDWSGPAQQHVGVPVPFDPRSDWQNLTLGSAPPSWSIGEFRTGVVCAYCDRDAHTGCPACFTVMCELCDVNFNVCECDFNIGEVGRELVEAVEAMYPSDPTSVADDVAMD